MADAWSGQPDLSSGRRRQERGTPDAHDDQHDLALYQTRVPEQVWANKSTNYSSVGNDGMGLLTRQSGGGGTPRRARRHH
jgi:hypothetical protein